MVLHFVRILFFVIMAILVISFALNAAVAEQGQSYITLYILIPLLLAGGLILADIFWQQKKLNVLSGLFLGLLVGLLIAYSLSVVIDLGLKLYPGPAYVEKPAPPTGNASASELDSYQNKVQARAKYDLSQNSVQLAKLLIGTMCVFFCITIVLQTKDEFRFIIPYVEFSKQTKGSQPTLLDTSVIIDGRINDILKTRILQSELIVPRFVLAELQTIADSQDKLKRNRGRRGLDILQKLQNNERVDINILEANVPAVEQAPDVDAKLVALADHLTGRLMTNDYNLNKIAQLRGIDVINLNDLANALKPVVLPGEQMTVKILRPGEEAGQGVGYLDDGTMVVADGGREAIGHEIDITVTSVLQTSAGRMIFGRASAGEDSARGGAPRRGGFASRGVKPSHPGGDPTEKKPEA